MKEIVKKIVEQEEQARNEVEAAKEKAKMRRIEAENESDSIVRKIREKCKKESNELLKKEREKALAQKEEELNKSVNLADKIWNENRIEVENTIEKLFLLVIEKEKRE